MKRTCIHCQAASLGALAIVALMAVRPANADDANGTITAVHLKDVPAPAADGWYEIGVAGYQRDADNFGSTKADGVGYVDWNALSSAGLPADAKIRFVGGVALDALPDGYSYDFSQMKNVAVLKSAVFTKMAVPTGCVAAVVEKHPYKTPNPEISGTTASITWALNNMEISTVVTNYGTIVAGTGSNNNHIYKKGIRGTGICRMNGYGRWLQFEDFLDFGGGTFYHYSNTDYHKIIVATSDDDPKLGKYQMWAYNAVTPYLLYNPVRATPGTLHIGSMACTSSYMSGLANTGTRRRGVQICVCNGNAIHIEKPALSTGKSVGFFAGTAPIYAVGNPPTFEEGLGTIILGNDVEVSDQFEPDAMYVSPQMNITLKKFVTRYLYGTHHMTFSYMAETNVVNKSSLDASGMDASSWFGDGTTDFTKYAFRVEGCAPYNLPRSIKVPNVPRALNQSFVKISDTEWTMPFDFGASDPDEINPARCETNCKLEIPAEGTVIVRNDTTVEGDEVYPEKKKLFPILTCSSGGEAAFANWEVRFTGDWSRCRVRKVVTDTGLYVAVGRQKGLCLLFR